MGAHLRDSIYAAVKRRIILNELRPGVVLTELGLAADLGCSQGPVREALMRLQEDGLVLRKGHHGTVVTPLNPEEAGEILALRRRIEVRAAPRAARSVDARTLERLAALNVRMIEAARAGDEYGLIELDMAFHLEIFRLANLQALEQILVRCILHSHRQKLWEPRHRRSLVDTAIRHDVLCERLAARDGQGLADALGQHIDTIVEIQPVRGVMSVDIDPDMMPILAVMRAAPPVDYAAMSMEAARVVWNRGVAPWCALAPAVRHVDDLTIAGPAGPMRARLYRATDGILPLVVFVHGGGWTFGSVDSHEVEMRSLALASGAAVLGFDYRLAPEHPFPAALDDVLAVLAGVRNGVLGDAVDTSRIAFAGDSAGANLALGTLLWLRDAGGPAPAGAALFYGCFTPSPDSASHRLFGGGDFGLTTSRMDWYWRNFLATAYQAPPAYAAPLGAVLDGLPPLHLVAAGLDPLRDDTLALAKALTDAGVSHDLEIVPGVIHGFLGRAPKLPAAQRALASAGAFLGRALANKD